MSDTASQALRYLFILSLLLILVAYYVGTTHVGATFFDKIVSLIYAGTGRTQAGTFAAYPGGGGAPA